MKIKARVDMKNSNTVNHHITTYRLSLVGLFCALIAVSAFIRVPTPVMPFTLQIFVVLLAPMVLGLRASFLSIFLYITIGLSGFPIFASGGGPAYVLQPSFGFLLGYLLSTIPSALIINGRQRASQIKLSTSVERKRSFIIRNIIAGLSALFVIYAVGIIYFWLNMRIVQSKDISLFAATVVMAPFFIPDLIKCCMAVTVSYKLRKVFYKLSKR